MEMIACAPTSLSSHATLARYVMEIGVISGLVIKSQQLAAGSRPATRTMLLSPIHVWRKKLE